MKQIQCAPWAVDTCKESEAEAIAVDHPCHAWKRAWELHQWGSGAFKWLWTRTESNRICWFYHNYSIYIYIYIYIIIYIYIYSISWQISSNRLMQERVTSCQCPNAPIGNSFARGFLWYLWHSHKRNWSPSTISIPKCIFHRGQGQDLFGMWKYGPQCACTFDMRCSTAWSKTHNQQFG